MKYQPGDTILILTTDEEGKVIEIIDDKMILIEVKGVRFPIHNDQIDFPYFKLIKVVRIYEILLMCKYATVSRMSF